MANITVTSIWMCPYPVCRVRNTRGKVANNSLLISSLLWIGPASSHAAELYKAARPGYWYQFSLSSRGSRTSWFALRHLVLLTCIFECNLTRHHWPASILSSGDHCNLLTTSSPVITCWHPSDLLFIFVFKPGSADYPAHSLPVSLLLVNWIWISLSIDTTIFTMANLKELNARALIVPVLIYLMFQLETFITDVAAMNYVFQM